MKQHRALEGVVTGVIVLGIAALDNYVLPVLPSAVLLAVVALAASWELCVILEAAGFSTYPKLTAFASFVVALLPAVVAHVFPDAGTFAPQSAAIFLFVVLTFALGLAKTNHNAAVKAVVAGTFVLVYVGFALSFLVRLRGIEPDGMALLILVLGCAKAGDSGAYFVGRAIGKRLLAPRVSPKKTIEGCLGALVVSLLFAYAISFFLDAELSLVYVLAAAVVLSLAAQFGDLAESLLKRAGTVKDSGALLGHMGGALDAVDSLLLCAPTAYILARLGGLGVG